MLLSDSTEMALVELEVERRTRSQRTVDLRADLFAEQRAVYDDPEKTILVLGSRRSGKSEVIVRWLLAGAMERPGFVYPYIAQSRKNAKLIAWETLKRVLRLHLIQATPNEADLTVRLPNGSTILLGGCNDRSEVERWRGLKCGRVAVDECGVMPYLSELVETVRPSLMDIAGPMLLAGTPGVVWSGLWYELTGPGRAEESPPLHTWTMFENPHIPAAHDEARRYKRERAWDDDHPTWRREYLGQWAYDQEALVFPWDAQDSADSLPDYRSPWRYTLGVDVGVVDASAFVLLACHANDPHDWVIESRKQAGLTTGQVAEVCQQYARRYQCPVVMDVGGMGKAHALELSARYGVGVHSADKRQKESAIRVLRDRFRAHAVKILHGQQNDPLRDELAVLRWDDDRTDLADGQEDHAAHALLYGHRLMRHYLYEPPRPAVSDVEAEAERILQAQIKRHRPSNRPIYDR